MTMLFADVKKDSIAQNGILTTEWKPKYKEFEYPKDFVDWVDSINTGWQNKVKYIPFELYCRQAESWLRDETELTDFQTEEEQYDWLTEEITRCQFCNKYGWIKEDKSENGMLRYQAWDAQKVLLFLFDCGYSMMIGKADRLVLPLPCA
jgi:hypothetical protein